MDEFGQRRGRFKILPIIIFLVIGIIYYLSSNETNEYTGRNQLVGMSIGQEMELGLQSYKEVLSSENLLRSGPEVDLVKAVGARIAKASENDQFQWEYNVIKSDQQNAFCMPGGKVAVYSGIIPIAKNADGLAVIMGHEISHALARHGAERMAHSQLAQLGQLAVGMASNEMEPAQRQMVMAAFGAGAQFGIMLPFSRSHESEADRLGLILMAKACFNPREAPEFWKRMAESQRTTNKPIEFMSTHPSDETRISNLNSWMPNAVKLYEENCP